jgi:hypothetical protein
MDRKVLIKTVKCRVLVSCAYYWSKSFKEMYSLGKSAAAL